MITAEHRHLDLGVCCIMETDDQYEFWGEKKTIRSSLTV